MAADSSVALFARKGKTLYEKRKTAAKRIDNRSEEFYIASPRTKVEDDRSVRRNARALAPKYFRDTTKKIQTRMRSFLRAIELSIYRGQWRALTGSVIFFNLANEYNAQGHHRENIRGIDERIQSVKNKLHEGRIKI